MNFDYSVVWEIYSVGKKQVYREVYDINRKWDIIFMRIFNDLIIIFLVLEWRKNYII